MSRLAQLAPAARTAVSPATERTACTSTPGPIFCSASRVRSMAAGSSASPRSAASTVAPVKPQSVRSRITRRFGVARASTPRKIGCSCPAASRRAACGVPGSSPVTSHRTRWRSRTCSRAARRSSLRRVFALRRDVQERGRISRGGRSSAVAGVTAAKDCSSTARSSRSRSTGLRLAGRTGVGRPSGCSWLTAQLSARPRRAPSPSAITGRRTPCGGGRRPDAPARLAAIFGPRSCSSASARAAAAAFFWSPLTQTPAPLSVKSRPIWAIGGRDAHRLFAVWPTTP